MIPGIWTRWSHELPPMDTSIEGAWNDAELDGNRYTTGKRCKRGCCFYADFGASLITPKWWRVPLTVGESRGG